MFINEYDILIDKILDEVFNNIDITKINSKYLELNINKNNKYLNNISNLTKDIERQKQIICITNNIINAYLICGSFLNDDIKNIKTILIKSKILDSEDLGDILTLNEDIESLLIVLNEENKEKLLELYKINIKYKNAVDLLNKFGYENTIRNLKGDNTKLNKHNLIKLVVFTLFYRKRYRKKIFNLINYDIEDEKIIEIVLPKLKLLDYNNIENILDNNEIKSNLANEILQFYENYESIINFKKTNYNKITDIFNSKLLIPITDDFLRYHKITEKYEKNSTQIKKSERENIIDQTKIRYIISKIEKLKDYYAKKTRNNKELLKDLEKNFYKPLIYKKAIIYNEIEELNIINKLKNQGKMAIESNEFYRDLIDLRKSSYVNFKDFKDDGFTYKPKNTLTVVRYAGIESLKDKTLTNKNIKLDIKTISKNNKANIVGVLVLDNSSNIYDLSFKDIKDIRTINNNGFESTKNILLNKINNNNKTNYYWLFDSDKDIFSQDTYEKSEDLINILVSKSYDYSIEAVYLKIINKLEKYDKLDIYYSNYINNYYQKKLLKIPKYSVQYNNINKKIISLLPTNNDQKDKMENTIYGIIGKTYKLPIDTNKFKDIPIFTIPYENKDEIIEIDNDNRECQHTIDWINLSMLRNQDPNKHTELLYGFIKKYVITNNDNVYICKSCKQLVDIQNYLSNPYEGGISGIDIILTTSKNLNEIKEYSKYSLLIKNIDKLVERIAQITNFNFYVGNEQIHKLRRQDIIKQVIDIITIHNKTLKVKNMSKRDREIKASQNYNISPDYTFFFIFALSDDIFKFSSKEVDKFKKIKINNIIAYILFFMIIDLNDSQINMFEFDKTCNFLLYKKFGHLLFDKLKLKINNTNDVINVKDLDTFCYILYYISCMISKYNIWYMTTLDKINISTKQKSIIHTLIDLMNSLIEVFSNKDSNFIYEVIASKIFNKINNLFKNKKILDAIEEKENKKISININTNKIQIIKSKISNILLSGDIQLFKDEINDFIYRPVYSLKSKYIHPESNEILKKEIINLEKIYIKDNFIKLAQLYNNDGKIRSQKISYENAAKYNEKYYNEKIKNKKNIKKKNKRNNKNNKEISEHIIDFKNKSRKIDIKTDNINNILNIIQKIIGNNIKLHHIEYNLIQTKIKLKYDYLANPLNKEFSIQLDDNKLNIKNDKELDSKIYEIFDASNDIKLIFNYYTLHYLGYKQSSRKFTDMRSFNIYSEYIPSIKEIFTTLGFKKNIYLFNNKKELNNEIRKSVNNLKQYIRQYKLFVYQIKFKLNNDSLNPIIKNYINKIDNIILTDSNKTIFDNIDLVLNLEFDNIENNNNLVNISKFQLIQSTKLHEKLINYLISELLILLTLNNNKYIQTNLIYFILYSLEFFYYQNYEQYTKFELIRYNYLLDAELVEEIRETMVYNENELKEELSDEQQETIIQQQYDDDEKTDALDDDQVGYDDDDN